jgi:hypothetical protein
LIVCPPRSPFVSISTIQVNGKSKSDFRGAFTYLF